MGRSIGTDDESMWKIPTMARQEGESQQLESFRSTISNKENKHKLELEFMANCGIRQLGPPRIGCFADRISPEPLHLELTVGNIFWM